MSPRRRRAVKVSRGVEFIKSIPPQYLASLIIAIFTGFGCNRLNHVQTAVDQTAVTTAAVSGDMGEALTRISRLEALTSAQARELKRLGGRLTTQSRRTQALIVERQEPNGVARAVHGFWNLLKRPFGG